MRFFIFVLHVLRFVLGTFFKPLVHLGFRFYYKNIKKLDYSRPLPACKSDLLLIPANKLAKKIRNKEVSSEQVVQAYISRIKEVNVLLNCVVETCFDEALEQARNVDRILTSNESLDEKYLEENAPLLGVPFSCKESFWVKGMPNTTGVIARKHFRAPEDSPIVKQMRQAGAILTCLTNTSEACMWFESNNYLYGTSNNPYNLSRIVGGSSGGEGCLISSAGSLIGLGSDIGGSIRMPAFFNGIYGIKPSANLVNNEAQHPPPVGNQVYMQGTGPLCRYVINLLLFL
jgi:fatty acid amide hydrolase 2